MGWMNRVTGAFVVVAALTWTAMGTASAKGLTPSGATQLSVAQTAKILAGTDVTPLAELDDRKRFATEYASMATEKWSRYQQKIATPLRDWAAKQLPSAAGETVYYPFAGPDLPTVHLLYPDAKRYVLIALQKGGRVPRLATGKPAVARLFFRVFSRGWKSFAHRGFFHTDHMNRDMNEDSFVEGVTPVLMGFAAGLGYEVLTVSPIRVNADGSDLEPHPGDKTKRETWDSVRLLLKRADGTQVTVDYLHMDLSDGFLKKDEAHRSWVEMISKNKVVTKAASHLMQKPFFSIVKQAILEHATSIWQDETGIDYSELDKHFDTQLFGEFTRANKLWHENVQRSLSRAYAKRKDIQPLPFRVGYNKDSGSCVQYAVRRN